MKPNNDNVIERAEKIVEYMKANRRFCTKEELGEYIGCSERIVRDCINYLRNHGRMIVSVSSQKGYKILTKKDIDNDSAELVKQMWCEIDNRIKELESMKQVCINYWNYRENLISEQYKQKAEESKKNDK